MKRILTIFFLILGMAILTHADSPVVKISGGGYLTADSVYFLGWGMVVQSDTAKPNISQMWADSVWKMVYAMIETTSAEIPTATLADTTVGGAARATKAGLADTTIGGAARATSALLADSCVKYDTANTATYAEVRTTVTDTTWDMKNGFAWTGAHDYGGATSFELPNAANPTTDAEGEMAWDSDDDMLEIYNGAISRALPTVDDKEATIVNPVDLGFTAVPLFHVSADKYPHGIALLSITWGQSAAGSDTFVLHEYSTDTTWASTIDSSISTARQSKETTIADVDIAADAWVFAEIANRDLDWMTVKIVFYTKEGD